MSKLVYKTVIFVTAIIIALLGTAFIGNKLNPNSKLSSLPGEVAGVFSSKFSAAGISPIGPDNVKAQVSSPYQNVSGPVAISGNVGIGSVNPQAPMEINDGSNNTLRFFPGSKSQIRTDAWNSAIEMYTTQSGGTNNFNQLYLAPTGNVGIGLSNPATKLQVNGTITASAFTGNATSANYQTATGTSNDWVASFQQTPAHGTSFREMSAGGPNGTWWFVQNFRHSNSSNYWGRQIAWGWEDNANEMYTRNIQAGVYGNWVEMISSSNIGSQSVNYANSAGSAPASDVPAQSKQLNQWVNTNSDVTFNTINSTWRYGYGNMVDRNNAVNGFMYFQYNVNNTAFYNRFRFDYTGAAYAAINNGGSGSWNGGNIDYAEIFYKENPADFIGFGELVIGAEGSKISHAEEKTNGKIIGIVSTAPGFISGGPRSVDNPETDKIELKDSKNSSYQAVALTGRVPAKVIYTNESINVGDRISASVVAGIGEKAKKSGMTAGSVLETFQPNDNICSPAASLETIVWPKDDGFNPSKPCYKIPVSSFDNETKNDLITKYNLSNDSFVYIGKIMVFVNVSWYDPDVYLTSVNNFHLDLNQLKDSANNLISKIGAFAEIVVGKIQAGIIETKQLVVNGVDIVTRLDAQQKEIDALKAEIEALKNR